MILWLIARSAAETELTLVAGLRAPLKSVEPVPEAPVAPGLIGELLSVVELVPFELSAPEDALLSGLAGAGELLL